MKLAPRYDGPPIMTIDGRPDDQLAPVTRQRRRLASALAELSDEEWSTPSRCDGWTVQDVIAHLVGVDSFWQVSVAAGVAGDPTRVLDGFDPAATPPLMVAPMRVLSPAETLERFVAASDAFLASLAGLDDAGWSAPAETPAGHVPVRLLAHHALWDAWIHERDIALPLGRTPAVETDEVESCLRYAAVLGPSFAISNGKGVRGEFTVDATEPALTFTLRVGDGVAVGGDDAPADAPCLRGDAVDLVEALSLRAPLPASTPPEWRDLVAGLATAFGSELDQL